MITAFPVAPILYFYPRPPYGGRLPSRTPSGAQHIFLSTPSVRRATVVRSIAFIRIRRISIHALRTEGDGAAQRRCYIKVYFYPRPPYGGRH